MASATRPSTSPPSAPPCASTRRSSTARDRRGHRGRRLRRGREPAADAAADVDAAEAERAAERRELLFQALASLGIGGVMMAIMFWPGGTPWPMTDINRWFLIPATIVQFVFGRRFLVAAARGARHGEANMNTLVAIGTLAAYTYSVFVTLLPDVGDGRRARPRDLLRLRGGDHRARPARPVARGARQGPGRRCRAGAARAATRRPRACCAPGGEREVPRRARSSSATCCACAPAIASRSTAS